MKKVYILMHDSEEHGLMFPNKVFSSPFKAATALYQEKCRRTGYVFSERNLSKKMVYGDLKHGFDVAITFSHETRPAYRVWMRVMNIE